MFCIIAFVILAILGIFSASNRALAKEALDCVFRRVTLRPCNTGFDEKMKAKILGSVITRSETAARLINKNFELLSWTFFILMVASSVWALRGVYLFYVTGSCNGLNQAAFCVFDPKGSNNEVSGLAATCKVTPTTEKDLTLDGVNLTGFPVLNENSKDKIVFIGCYHCDYTRKAYPLVMDLVKRTNASFTFMHYPVKENSDYMTKLGYCAYQQDPKKYWQMNDIFFTGDKMKLDDPAYIQQTLTGLGYETAKITTCVDSPQTEETVQKLLDEVVKTKFYGTPTVFINNQVLVGPKPYRVYAILLNGLLYWLK
jgi:protein-disulfide isomerase